MANRPLPLSGQILGLSISESEDSEGRGFPSSQVNRVIVQVATALFGQGVAVVFGHDWREDGVMEVVHAMAQRVQPSTADAGGPLMRNLLPWPDRPTLSQEERAGLSSTLHVERAGLPAGLADAWRDASARIKPGAEKYLRARGLTHLRHRLVEASTARLCIGGRRRGFAGRYAGIVEEAWLTLLAGQPLYLAGVLGGATREVIGAIRGDAMPADFSRAGPELVELYAQPPVSEFGVESAGVTARDREIAPTLVWEDIQRHGHRHWIHNGLTAEKNAELHDTGVLERVIELVLEGLGNVARHERG